MTEGQIKVRGDEIKEFRGKCLTEIVDVTGKKRVVHYDGANVLQCAMKLYNDYTGSEEIKYYTREKKEIEKDGKKQEITIVTFYSD